LDVEEDYSDLIFDGNILVKQDWNNIAHVISDLLTLCICAHGKILLNLAQLINITLKECFPFISQKLECEESDPDQGGGPIP